MIRAAQSHELAVEGQAGQHGQAEATELGVAVYAVAVVEEFSLIGPTNMMQIDVKCKTGNYLRMTRRYLRMAELLL